MVFISPVVIPALVLGGLFYDFFNSELPPGIDQPLKLRVFHSLLITTMTLVSPLFKNWGFPFYSDEVPLRIYQPKWPPTGKRRGILYFHGGAGTFGSISKKSASFIFKIKSKPLHFYFPIYRLAPEHPYPGQYFDCLNATLYFMRNLEEYHVDPALIIISGDSCGANFATVILCTC
uniref:Alpha/beta hydrolase fold-3 domain-containing protein n=1 Tax=Otus sunia TaxID=257818 RepID=A0A8C8B720_9STRI